MPIFAHPEFDQHEQVMFCHDKSTGLKAIIAVHNTRLGPALGGCRMWPYADEQQALNDVLRLSRGMTYKSALAGLPLGGGKAVIIADPRKDKSDALFHAMGRFVESLGGRYITAADSGTGVAEMALMGQRTRHVVGAGVREDMGGGTRSGDPSPSTALGVFMGLREAVLQRLGRADLTGLRVAVQGLGQVGFNLAQQLKAQPDSAYLQHALGLWLLHHDQLEFALLGLSKAVELEPDNKDYRYDLATTLHSAEELEAAQNQLQEIVQRHPADRKARVLLINYWKESGQLQNVQVLLAQLEQLNPDDPALPQGL